MTDATTLEGLAESLLVPENQPEPETEVEAEGEAPDTVEPEAEDVQEDDEAEAQADDAPEDEAEEYDEDEQAPQAETFTVKVDGQDVAVSLDDLKRSYSGDAYIQQGMQKAAAARKEAESLYSQLQAQQQQFSQTVQSLNQTGIIAKPQAPDPALANSDPIGYLSAKAEYDGKVEAYNGQQQQIQAVTAQQQQAQAYAQQQFLEQQREILHRAIPELSDPEKAPEIAQRLQRVGSEHYGLKPEEVTGIQDARFLQILHDAVQFRNLQSGTAKAKAVGKVKPARNLKPRSNVRNKGAEQQKARQKILNSGNLHDMASLLLKPE